jgi:hypothetical protein
MNNPKKPEGFFNNENPRQKIHYWMISLKVTNGKSNDKYPGNNSVKVANGKSGWIITRNNNEKPFGFFNDENPMNNLLESYKWKISLEDIQ